MSNLSPSANLRQPPRQTGGGLHISAVINTRNPPRQAENSHEKPLFGELSVHQQKTA